MKNYANQGLKDEVNKSCSDLSLVMIAGMHKYAVTEI